MEGYAELLQTIEALDLVEQVAPIQLAIRLLVTTGSPLLELADIRAVTAAFDPASLTWPWRHADPRVDALQEAVMRLVGTNVHASRSDTFAAIGDLAGGSDSREGGRASLTPRPSLTPRTVPHLTEAWYCCAEPSLEDLRLCETSDERETGPSARDDHRLSDPLVWRSGGAS